MKSGLHDDTDGYAREGVALLLKDDWFERMFDCKCVSARLIEVKFKHEG